MHYGSGRRLCVVHAEPGPERYVVLKHTKPVSISSRAARLSELWKTTLDNDLSASIEFKVEWSSVVSAHLKQYLDHHNGSNPPKPTATTRSRDTRIVPGVGSFDTKFIHRVFKTSFSALIDLFDAAMYLDIQSLTCLCVAKIGIMLRHKTLRQIYNLFVLAKPARALSDTKLRDVPDKPVSREVFEQVMTRTLLPMIFPPKTDLSASMLKYTNDDFVLEFRFQGRDRTLQLPFYGGAAQVQVEWGDGTIDNKTKHTYNDEGDFTVRISGKMNGFGFGVPKHELKTNRDQLVPYTNTPSGQEWSLIRIKQWGCVNFGNRGGNFFSCENLQPSTDISDIPDLTGISNLKHMFFLASNVSLDLSKWDVSRVTNMTGMFHSAGAFDSDLSKWDVGRVTNMSEMFASSTVFTSDLSTWNVSRVTDMSEMFKDAAAFRSDLTAWDTRSITQLINMRDMLEGADAFQLDQTPSFPNAT